MSRFQASHLNSLVCGFSVDSGSWFSFFGDVDLEVGALELLKHKQPSSHHLLMAQLAVEPEARESVWTGTLYHRGEQGSAQLDPTPDM